MKKLIALIIVLCFALTAITAYIFAGIGYNQAINRRDFTDWVTWIDDDYNICIYMDDGSILMIPWCSL